MIDNNIKIIKTFCLWADLLGYGKPLSECNWDLKNEKAKMSLSRINNMHWTFDTPGFIDVETALVLNDGLAKSADFYELDTLSSDYIHWFDRILLLYSNMNSQDKTSGFPGVRAVLTTGTRYSYREEIVRASRYTISGNKESQKIVDNNILLYSPAEFQMNTAFSKAYIVENSGSSNGISGANLYIDFDVLITLKNYLEKKQHYFDILHVIKKDSNGFSKIKLEKATCKYKVKIMEVDDMMKFEIVRIYNNKYHTLTQLWMDSSYIDYKANGINTKFYRALKYNPIDEKDFTIEF